MKGVRNYGRTKSDNLKGSSRLGGIGVNCRMWKSTSKKQQEMKPIGPLFWPKVGISVGF